MTEPTARVKAYQAAFVAWAATEPKKAMALQRDLMLMAGFENAKDMTSNSQFSFSFVKIGVDELDGVGTACGNLPNVCLGDGFVRSFLVGQGVEFVLGISENQQPLLYAAALPLSKRAASTLERLIELAGGSLRADETDFRGWTVFESE
jgi:hypothetical protein